MRFPAQVFPKQYMHRCAWQPLFAPESMCYLHQVVVHYHRKVVSRHAICFQQHLVVNEVTVEGYLTAYHIGEGYGLILRHFYAHHMWSTILYHFCHFLSRQRQRVEHQAACAVVILRIGIVLCFVLTAHALQIFCSIKGDVCMP